MDIHSHFSRTHCLTKVGSLATLALRNQACSLNAKVPVRCVALRSVTEKAQVPDNHDAKNEMLGRPMSPHITIYSFPLPAWLSITHRATGMALTGYMVAFGVGAVVLPHDFSYYMDVVQAWQLSGSTIAAGKFALAYPLTYHFVNGIRHLFWDTGKGLKMKDVYTSGYATLGLSTILAAAMSIL